MLEVLVSVFIISVGLLGVAALIPLGKLAISQTNIADRTGALGRAALRDVEVRRMLDYSSWRPVVNPAAQPGAIAFDPLSWAYYQSLTPAQIPPSLGPVPRYTFNITAALADAIFRCQDDLPFVKSEDQTINGERPVLAGTGVSEGNFSWFMTVCPSPSDITLNIPVGLRRDYTVSVVVCHKRDLDPTGAGEQATTQPVTFLGGGYGGGTIQLNVADAPILEHIKTDQWVMLVGSDNSVLPAVPVMAKWYRVVGVGAVGTPYVSLVGPDWDMSWYNGSSVRTDLVVVEGVTGVYTTTIHLDNDCTWTR